MYVGVRMMWGVLWGGPGTCDAPPMARGDLHILLSALFLYAATSKELVDVVTPPANRRKPEK